MCKHKKLIYIGKQGLPAHGEYLALFNCLDCQTTITLGFKKRGRVGQASSLLRQPATEPALIK